MIFIKSNIFIYLPSLILIVPTTVSAAPTSTITASLDPYIEDVFHRVTINSEVLNLLPLILPDVSIPVTKWYFPYKHLTLTGGTLQNLQSLKRKGNCSISYSSDEVIEVVIDAAFTDLLVNYNFEALSGFSLFSLRGRLKGTVHEAQVNAVISIDAVTMAVRAKEITFPGTSHLRFSIESTILATWVVNLILEVVSLFSGFIIDELQTAVTTEFNDFIGNRLPLALIDLVTL